MKYLHPGVVAWIPDFFSTLVRILSLTGLSSADSTDFHQDEKMEPRLWHCPEIEFHTLWIPVYWLWCPKGSLQCFQCPCKLLDKVCEKGSGFLRNTWQETDISHPYCPIWAFCPEAPQFRDSLPAVEIEFCGKLSPSALTLKKAKDLQEMIQTLFLTSIMTKD